ncbi:restriction endonuclease subunit S [Avibacterium paragallinarum]|uniref:restriction endonuclease subunit S n=1 Tax=Avibacterium paragallinarum TaxID=728 RepID=UPI0039786E56
MSEWKEFNLIDLVSFSQGIQVPVEEQYLEKNHNRERFIRIVDFTNPQELPRYIEKVNTKYLVTSDDIIMIRYGSATAGKVVRGLSGYIANNMFKIIVKDSNLLLNDFLYYFLSQKKIQLCLMNMQSSSTMPAIKFSDFKNIKIKIPSLQKQLEIVDILNNITNKITLNTQTNQTLEQIAQAIFKHWFIDFAPVHAKANALARGETSEQAELAAMTCLSGKTAEKITALKTQDPTAYHQLQQTAAAFPSEFVETEMGEVPRGWERTTLNYICEMKNGYAFKSKEWTDEGIPVIKIGSVKPMLIELDNGSFVAAENETLRADFLASEGDILVGLTGYVGEVGRIPYQEKAMINQRVAKFIPKKITETMNYYCFIYCLARQKEFKAFTEMNAKGSAQANISTREILSYPLIIATKEIHIAFENTVKNLLDKIIVNSGENSILTKTRDGLLPKLLNGELINGY